MTGPRVGTARLHCALVQRVVLFAIVASLYKVPIPSALRQCDIPLNICRPVNLHDEHCCAEIETDAICLSVKKA